SLADHFKKGFRGLGGKTVFEHPFGKDLEGDTPAKALMASAEKPEAVFVPAYFEESARFIREARRLGFRGLFLGGDGWHDATFTRIGEKAVEGAYFTTHFIADDPLPDAREFVAAYRKQFEEPPGTFAALGYDAGLAMHRALESGGKSGRGALRKAIAALKGLSGVTGNITLDEEGNTMKDAVVAQAREGGFRFVRRIPFRMGGR
ncbi:MAG: ABC transporter substrate-binding protein, partial [Planctomycetota bacterium]